MGTFTQEGGLFKIDTPLGKDVFLLQGFRGTEGISRLFRFELDLLSEKSSISFSDIVGKNVTLSLKQPDKSYRYLNGFISRFAQYATEEYFTAYSAEMVPWLWFLTRNADCRIFQNKSIPDIITQVFNDLGFHDYTNSLQGSYDPREYCVQYRESSFDFVSRLMEEYGIFYYFKHEHGKHTLVLADAPSAHISCPGQSSARYVTVAGGAQRDVITGWHMEQELRTGKYSLEDYNFKTPSTNLMASDPTVYEVGGNSKFEVYDYPGEYLTKGAGQSLAKLRMEEEEADHLVAEGTSRCRMFISGYKFTLEEHTRKDMNTDYVLTEIHHTAATDVYPSSIAPVGESYSNTFTCIPLSVPFRPPRVTPRPTVKGVQPAVVVGPSGEEIYVDNYGRVKVQFFWDRLGKKNENSSCWIRVSQPWAGKNWGAMWIPRIGQEVVVDFLEGDPDQPLITGRVYNAEQMPPYTLPDNKTQSGFRSRSSKSGTTENYNEIKFEDDKGKELITIHAEKDQLIEVENDETIKIHHDQMITVENDRTETVTNNETVTISGDRKHYVSGQEQLQTDGDLHLTASQNQNEKVGMTYSRQVGMTINDKANMNYGMDAGMNIHLKAGMSAVIEAGMGLTIKSAGGSIDINPVGVFIQGNLVFINTGAANIPGCGSSPTSPTSPIKKILEGLQIPSGAAPAAAAAASGMAQQAQQQMSMISSMASNVMKSVSNQAFGAVSQVAQQAVGAAQGAGQMAQGAASQVLGAINGAVNQAQSTLAGAVNQAQSMLNAGMNAVRSSVQQAVNQAAAAASQLANQASQLEQQAQQQLQQAANQAQQAAQQAAQQGQQALNQALQQGQQMLNQAQQTAKQAQQQLQQAANQVQQAANQAVQQGQQALNQATQQAAQMANQAQQTANQAVQQAQAAANQLQQAANQAVQQGQQQIAQAAKQAQQAANQAVQSAQQAANQAQQLAQQTQQQAQQMMQQTQQQVTQAANAAQQQVTQAANQAGQAVSNAAHQATQQAANAGQMAQGAANQVGQAVSSAASQASSTVGNAAQSAYSQAGKAAGQAAQSMQHGLSSLGI
jgi:type VI secretion system secreted protein VgrG